MAEERDPNLPFREEIKMDDGDSASNWMELLNELKDSKREEAPGPQPTPPTPVDVPDEPRGRTVEVDITPDMEDDTAKVDEQQRRRDRYQELCREPSMNIQKADMMVMSEFSDIIAEVNKAGKDLTRLRSEFEGVIQPRILNTCVENLKETATVMLREFHNMRHGRQEKKYDKRYVCVNCHQVFMVPLPGDRICDECRAGMTPRNSPY